MPLNINQGNSGDFLPYVKYNGKAGRWYVKKDEGEVEVMNPSFVADFDNIQTGWFFFAEGQAPSVVLDPSIDSPVAKPSDKHKRGFKLQLFSPQNFGGVVELQGASMHLSNAINEVYTQYEAERDANKGKLPVIAAEGTTAMKDKMGTNYRPNLKLVKWVDRPSDFDGGEAKQQAQTAPQAAPVNTVSEF